MAIGTIFVESGGGGLGRGAGVNDDAVKLYWWLSLSRLPAVVLGGDVFLGVASALRIELNRAFAILRDISSGKDLKKFLMAIAGLWVLSILGNCCNFLTLLFVYFLCLPSKTGFVLLHSVPVLYETYEDQVDAFAEKAEAEIKKQYAVFNVKVLSKIPKGPLKTMKLA
ncbi:reticulon B2 [Olea europaea subsp. europaea]|uniref:Reticulon-like protein n=1 Tax=Olea europaea subsp. europaea TaxID=158383 RepID=A0A8S0U881_OLEEU|nr:reticulon B2 [Olea europaea subsp. europaea]